MDRDGGSTVVSGNMVREKKDGVRTFRYVSLISSKIQNWKKLQVACVPIMLLLYLGAAGTIVHNILHNTQPASIITRRQLHHWYLYIG
eukprot:scaffold3263_cov121-Skeletonema_dohrnii-CCMP3373.AAC.8